MVDPFVVVRGLSWSINRMRVAAGPEGAMSDQLTELGKGGRVLVVHAHPDDETLATGATIADLAARGIEITLATASAGEAAEQGDVHDARRQREAKLQRAAQFLGISEQYRLGGPGRWVDDAGQGGTNSLTNADPAELSAEIVALIGRLRPELILTVGSDGITNHPDHILISSAVRAATDHLGGPPAFGACVLADDVSAARCRIAEFTSDLVGSGGVQGISAADLTFSAGDAAAISKRRALAEYAPVLADMALEELLAIPGPHGGDTELLRIVFDIAGWATEHYQRLN